MEFLRNQVVEAKRVATPAIAFSSDSRRLVDRQSTAADFAAVLDFDSNRENTTSRRQTDSAAWQDISLSQYDGRYLVANFGADMLENVNNPAAPASAVSTRPDEYPQQVVVGGEVYDLIAAVVQQPPYAGSGAARNEPGSSRIRQSILVCIEIGTARDCFAETLV